MSALHPLVTNDVPCVVVEGTGVAWGRVCTRGEDVVLWASGDRCAPRGVARYAQLIRVLLRRRGGLLTYWECHDLVFLMEFGRRRFFQFGIAKAVDENYKELLAEREVFDVDAFRYFDEDKHPRGKVKLPCEVLCVPGGDGEADLLCTPAQDVVMWASGTRDFMWDYFFERLTAPGSIPRAGVQELFRRREAFSPRYGRVVPVVSYWECNDLALCVGLFRSENACFGVARAVDRNYGALKAVSSVAAAEAV